MEASKQLKEQMREAFDKDDRYCRVRFSQMDQDSKQCPRYCATGDEKYYLDLPGKGNVLTGEGDAGYCDGLKGVGFT